MSHEIPKSRPRAVSPGSDPGHARRQPPTPHTVAAEARENKLHSLGLPRGSSLKKEKSQKPENDAEDAACEADLTIATGAEMVDQFQPWFFLQPLTEKD